MVQLLVLVSVAFFQGAALFSQTIAPYDLGGASKPRPDRSLKDGKQYKRVHQRSLRAILNGEIVNADSFLTQYLKDNPGDAETLYMLGVLNGQNGELQKAEKFLSRAIEAGLPDNRLVAGPRKMFEPLAKTDLLRSVFVKYKNQVVHGPLLGNVTESSASFWVRTANKSEVKVSVFDLHGVEVSSGRSVSKPEDDFATVVNVSGLRPDSAYQYSVFVDGAPCPRSSNKTFCTFKDRGAKAKFKVAFGGGSGYVPANERMWSTIEAVEPDAILLLGDNVYIDDPESVIMQQYTYQRRQSRPEWRKLTAKVPVYTIWDDHDFSTNDSFGGADIDLPFWKKDWVFPIFRQNWANPGYGGGDKQPGCWYSFRIGDVDFIMLDCRYYRTSPKLKAKSMLGKVQLDWLKKELVNSQGTFKVICSSVPFDFRTKGGSLDTWNGYRDERNEIFSFIEANKVEGVVLVSADRHRSDAWKISRPDGYDFYEFNSSRLTNQHVHPTMVKNGALFSYNKLQSFGLISFDTTLKDPTVGYEVVNIDGEKPHSLTIKRSQLK